MKNILVINSSTAGADSVTRVLVADTVSKLLEVEPNAKVTHRDLGETPVPHLTTATLAGVRGMPATEVELATRKLSDQLVGELRDADTIVIGAPMYNFSVATGLRSWFDYVLRSGIAFSYSEAGPKGLLGGRRVIVIEARGGLYSEGPAMAVDFQEPYLKHLFGFMGITDVTFIRAEKIGYGPDAKTAAVNAAKDAIAELVRPTVREAA